jgi:hypothetical protein
MKVFTKGFLQQSCIETTAVNKRTLTERSRTSGQNLRKAVPDALR